MIPSDPNIPDGVARALDTLEMHRVHRHNFAHWVVRKFKESEFLLFLTMNSAEAKKRDGVPLDNGHSKFAVVSLSLLSHELGKLQGHADYLAQIAVRVEKSRVR
ncbi:hypothetical protein [Rhizobium sp. S163]|uniref:hypothetical protein n=1 Tax=Rhizobium sp. S163 TaxID=3055039 RepID=UPI0025AA1691|nr:hypothetical protein [Rhizobium sp. S163]MDM9645557.1 hypothetical protein [Rhizobium sp. S163]